MVIKMNTVQYSGLNAFGKVVPENRRIKTYKFLKEVLPNLQEMEINYILKCAISAIEKDRTANLLDDVKRYLDVTGYYRLISELCTD